MRLEFSSLLLVTGASGYVGRAAQGAFLQHGYAIREATRYPLSSRCSDSAFYDMYRDSFSVKALFADVSCVVHCAGLAHRFATRSDYECINVDAAVRLAKSAVASGVSHFVFLSSMNVVPPGAVAPDADAISWPEPIEPYAASKWRAEQELMRVVEGSQCSITILRLGLVYDVELRANLATLNRLLNWCPISFPEVGCRTMVSRPDVARLLVSVVSGNSGAPLGQPILVATDGESYDAGRISRALSAAGPRMTLPGPLVRLASHLFDWRGRLESGSTWRSISRHYWCGLSPQISGWRPELTLETCRSASKKAK